MMLALLLIHLIASSASAAKAQASVAVYPVTEVNEANKTGYFSDPHYVPYEGGSRVYLSGTTPGYLECDNFLRPKCASMHATNYTSGKALLKQKSSGTHICSAAGIHPFQSGSGANRSWDAAVTLHVQDTPDCDGITGWSVIVHAHPADPSAVDVPPTHWVGDQLLIGSFSTAEEANYAGKYFRTPAGQLYLVYSKQQSPKPKKRDGIAAWPMDDPRTMTPGSNATFLLVPDNDFNSEDYVTGDRGFKLIETGNVLHVNGKFVMAYSAGAYFNKTYKIGIAYSDTFLPTRTRSTPQYYRKVMKDNPDHLWGSSRPKEVYYLLQADQNHTGWRYVGGQVLAPGVPTVARIGPDNGWVLTFAGYDPNDAPFRPDSNKYAANHRRPYFINLDVNVPANTSVEEASNEELRSWITPVH